LKKTLNHNKIIWASRPKDDFLPGEIPAALINGNNWPAGQSLKN
jgi:hypothetical protein